MKRSVAFVVFFLVFGFALAGLYWSQAPREINSGLTERDLEHGCRRAT